MFATTVSATEATPATYPAPPAGLSTAAGALSEAMLWQRLEGWIAYRWTPRSVTWIVEGPGAWWAPLTPASISATYRWTGEAWEACDLPAGPLGYALETGTFKVEATVGDVSPDTPPDAVLEAFRRLAEYMAETQDVPAGTRSYSADVGQLSESFTRDPAWQSKALHQSGAADLLRPYRRA